MTKTETERETDTQLLEPKGEDYLVISAVLKLHSKFQHSSMPNSLWWWPWVVELKPISALREAEQNLTVIEDYFK